MTIHNIAYIDGKYQVYATVNGIYRLNVGPRWLTPKEAADYANKLDAMPDASPLRGAHDANTGSDVSLPDSVGIVGTSDRGDPAT